MTRAHKQARSRPQRVRLLSEALGYMISHSGKMLTFASRREGKPMQYALAILRNFP